MCRRQSRIGGPRLLAGEGARDRRVARTALQGEDLRGIERRAPDRERGSSDRSRGYDGLDDRLVHELPFNEPTLTSPRIGIQTMPERCQRDHLPLRSSPARTGRG